MNELNYLEDHPAVVAGSDTVVFVLNHADLGAPSSWSNPMTHPREKPLSALVYLVQKYALKPAAPPTPADLVVPAVDPFGQLSAFLATCGCEADFWLCPTKAALLGTGTEPTMQEMRADLIDKAGVAAERIYLVQDISGWGPDLYKDSIHPTPAGFGILALGIAAALPAEEIAAVLPADG